MISIENLKLKVGDKIITSPHSLEYFNGNLHFIKGPSGSGKTTFLYVLGMISSQNDYRYYFDNHQISDFKAKENIKKTEFGFLYQNFNVQKELTLYENMKLFGFIKYKSFSKKRAKSLLSSVGLEKELSERTSNLSGGELQRFCLACILAKDPSTIIADEPTSALDKKNATHIMQILKDLSIQKNKTIIVATHSQDYDQLANTIDIIENGQILRIKNEIVDSVEKVDNRYVRNNSNFQFYIELFKSRIKIHIKKQIIPIVLSLFILSLCTYLSAFCDVVQKEYKAIMENEQTSEIYLIPKTNIYLNDAQINQIRSLKYVTDVHKVEKYIGVNAIVDGKELKNVQVYPMYKFQSNYSESGALVGSKYLKEIGNKVSISKTELHITQEMPLAIVSLYGAPKNSIFVPNHLLSEYHKIDTGILIVQYNRISHFESFKDEITDLDIAYDVYNPYLSIQNALRSLYSQIDILIYSTYILYAISFVLLLFIIFQDTLSKRKELSIYQANGVSRNEIISLEVIENCMRMILYLIIIYMINQLYIHFGNQFILKKIITIEFNYILFISIIILVVIFDFVPRLLSLWWMLRMSLENQLRSN